ncbi:U1 small nuclear ribonucleoprotein [Armadillidium nasatum]|uniref:U1 small nuclear ribonucleoprotein n=1 Tax=Armadillidium nasatum TaxID=96803 RepID=A0A5N5STE7_9CRUS|nr:U1 small nuclear ribonucleoprotein [Armadillidium nasatum]
MTQFLPPHLLELFAPPEPLEYWPPIHDLKSEKEESELLPIDGVALFMHYFEDPSKTNPNNQNVKATMMTNLSEKKEICDENC